VGIAASFLGPPLLGAAVVRGTDGVLGASIHRSAYEVLFAPLDARRRRAWKPLLDVLGDRIGMMLGNGVAAAVVATTPGHARAVLLLVVAAFAVVRVEVARAPARDSELSIAGFDLPPGPLLDPGQASGPPSSTPAVRADTLLALAELASGDARRTGSWRRSRPCRPAPSAPWHGARRIAARRWSGWS
jgi:hypothetical protein